MDLLEIAGKIESLYPQAVTFAGLGKLPTLRLFDHDVSHFGCLIGPQPFTKRELASHANSLLSWSRVERESGARSPKMVFRFESRNNRRSLC